MKIATSIGYWSAGPPPDAAELFAAAERLEFDQIWTAEAYGSDAWTPLAWWGSATRRVRLGTAVSQISARPPATLAMTAMTMDHLTGGRLIVGVGTSNPQVVEGWYGQPYPRPLERTREYIDIFRAAVARAAPVEYQGLALPAAAGRGHRAGQAAAVDPAPLPDRDPGLPRCRRAQERRPGGGDRRRVERDLLLTEDERLYAAALAEGFARPGARHTAGTFDVVGGPMRIIVDEDIERAADLMRPTLALYVGGMGARGVNYHHEVFARMGYEAEAKIIQDRYLAGDRAGAIAAVPTRMVEDVALIGPWAKIADEILLWQDTVLTTFSISSDLRHLAKLAELVRG